MPTSICCQNWRPERFAWLNAPKLLDRAREASARGCAYCEKGRGMPYPKPRIPRLRCLLQEVESSSLHESAGKSTHWCTAFKHESGAYRALDHGRVWVRLRSPRQVFLVTDPSLLQQVSVSTPSTQATKLVVGSTCCQVVRHKGDEGWTTVFGLWLRINTICDTEQGDVLNFLQLTSFSGRQCPVIWSQSDKGCSGPPWAQHRGATETHAGSDSSTALRHEQSPHVCRA
jgi:hypothetical protein